ncbi:MAG: arylsulfatase [Verrucomicrobia bacterium]|nr:arylsulfatase [Verrucomicrobiota bacterium]
MNSALALRFLAVVFSLSVAMTAFAQNTPNIVILYADDMGYGDLSAQNPESRIPTPHLDQLASEGTRFTDAHSSSGICSPSRYALLTGRYHWRKFHNIVNAFGPSVFGKDELTLPEMLRRKGYDTACIGKWHLGWNWDSIKRPGAKPKPIPGTSKTAFSHEDFDWAKPVSDGPLDHGFDFYFGDDVPNFPPYAWIENDRIVTVPTAPLTETPKTAEGNWEARPGPMVADWKLDAVMPRLTEKSVEWIRGRKGSSKPFFLYFPFTSPHAPIVPAKAFVGRSQAGGYGDFVAQTDWTVGEVLKALHESGFDENTLVIFTSDNGPERYAYDRIRNFQHRSMGPLRGLKRDIWEGGHRVPFLIRWPGVVPENRVSDALVSQIDLMATIAKITGSELPPNSANDSHNQLELFQGGTLGARDALVHNTFKDHYAIRGGNWVFIDAESGAVSRVPEWFDEANGYGKNAFPGALYDLSQDIAQRQNLYARFPDKVRELKERLQRIRAEGEVRELQ